jgi:hypothetical protein
VGNTPCPARPHHGTHRLAVHRWLKPGQFAELNIASGRSLCGRCFHRANYVRWPSACRPPHRSPLRRSSRQYRPRRHRSLPKSGPAIVFDDLCALAQSDWCPGPAPTCSQVGRLRELKVLDASQMIYNVLAVGIPHVDAVSETGAVKSPFQFPNPVRLRVTPRNLGPSSSASPAELKSAALRTASATTGATLTMTAPASTRRGAIAEVHRCTSVIRTAGATAVGTNRTFN